MISTLPHGEELMPHREQQTCSAASQADLVSCNSQSVLPTTPIRKLTRNRGLVIQEESVVEDSPVVDDDTSSRANAIRKCKRKLHWGGFYEIMAHVKTPSVFAALVSIIYKCIYVDGLGFPNLVCSSKCIPLFLWEVLLFTEVFQLLCIF